MNNGTKIGVSAVLTIVLATLVIVGDGRVRADADLSASARGRAPEGDASIHRGPSRTPTERSRADAVMTDVIRLCLEKGQDRPDVDRICRDLLASDVREDDGDPDWGRAAKTVIRERLDVADDTDPSGKPIVRPFPWATGR